MPARCVDLKSFDEDGRGEGSALRTAGRGEFECECECECVWGLGREDVATPGLCCSCASGLGVKSRAGVALANIARMMCPRQATEYWGCVGVRGGEAVDKWSGQRWLGAGDSKQTY